LIGTTGDGNINYIYIDLDTGGDGNGAFTVSADETIISLNSER